MAPKSLFPLLLAAAPSALAEILYATSYNDHALSTLHLDGSSLTVVSRSLDCGSEPTWLTLDKAHSLLYCLNEGWNGGASLSSFSTAADGNLTTLDVLPVTKSPVASTLFGRGNANLAIAHYDTSTFSVVSARDPKSLALSWNATYTLAAPGPNPDRQEAPHLHDAVLDPTRQWLLVNDLGSDLVRLYRAGANGTVTPEEPIKAVSGSGPRHSAFVRAGRSTFFYMLNELSNSITGYSVDYGRGAAAVPKFTQILYVPSHGPNTTVPVGTKASEIVVSPDQRFIIISSRLEYSLTTPNPDPSNSTAIASDPLITFAVDHASGALTKVQEAPAGGVNPRGFSLNKAGTLVASALQDNNRVVVIERDVKTGKLGAIRASATVGDGAGNGPNYALFYE